MKQVEIKNGERYGKLVKVLQVLSFAFMLAMLLLCVVFLSKNHISVKTADQLTQYLTGGELTVALILIGFSVVKSFALVFKDMVDFLKGRFKAIRKLDAFAGQNDFAVVLVFKAGGFLPSDLSSLLFGAMNIPFRSYFFASNLGMLVLNVLWTLVGFKGDLSNPLSFLYALPALVFAVLAAVGMSVYKKKKAAKLLQQNEK